MSQVLVIDFGAEYAQLIARRVRELGFSAELIPFTAPLSRLRQAGALILSGGPSSGYGAGAARAERNFLARHTGLGYLLWPAADVLSHRRKGEKDEAAGIRSSRHAGARAVSFDEGHPRACAGVDVARRCGGAFARGHALLRRDETFAVCGRRRRQEKDLGRAVPSRSGAYAIWKGSA